jgi:hypothetical protein
VFLHPKGHVVDGDDVDLGSAYAISKFGDLEMETRKWRRKKRMSSVELQKYRTGPIVDAMEDSQVAENMSYTAVSAPTIESRMKSELSHRGFADGSRHGSMDSSRASGRGELRAEDDEEDGGDYPQGMSLENATEVLLAWPPTGSGITQPHASVLERRQDVILQNLRERTVPVVSLSVPHILVCCQSRWPDNLFYFVKELRKPQVPSPPIVILHPNVPNAAEWGKVGIFKDVLFLKGSPIYELDLMRAGVLQAGKARLLQTLAPKP